MLKRTLTTTLVTLALIVGLVSTPAAQNVTNAIVVAALRTMGLFGVGYATGDVPVWNNTTKKYVPSSGAAGSFLTVTSASWFRGGATADCTAPEFSATTDTDTGWTVLTTANTGAWCTNGIARLTVNTASVTSTLPILFSSDNSVDIGALLASRPRTGYFGTSLVNGGALAYGTAVTAGITNQNTSAATVGTTVQISPSLEWSGTAWDTDDAISRTVKFFSVALPANANTPTGTWKLGYVHPVTGATTYPFTVDNGGDATALGNLFVGGGRFRFSNANGDSFQSASDALFNYRDGSDNFGVQINVGTAAPTFNNGTVTTGSRNTAGQMTLTGGNTGGTITFGAPNWTNTPFCTLTGSAATDTPYITAASASAITIAGITANGVFTYHCLGRI